MSPNLDLSRKGDDSSALFLLSGFHIVGESNEGKVEDRRDITKASTSHGVSFRLALGTVVLIGLGQMFVTQYVVDSIL